jgi:DNA polymerase (family 10)
MAEPMDNKHYAQTLKDVAALLQIKGENRFRVRAFENAAQTIDRLSESIEERLAEQTVEELSGIGSSIAEDLRQIQQTGTCEIRTRLLDELDAGLLEMLDIQGLGPKRIKKIYEEMEITTVEALREAAEGGEIQEISGFGAKTEQNILDEIERLAQKKGRTPLPAADRVARGLQGKLAEMEAVDRVEIAGSLRRGRETIGDVDLLVATDDPEAVVEPFVAYPEVDDVLARGSSKASVRLMDGLQVDLRFVDRAIFGAALHYFTGSKAHHVQLRSRAKRQGYKISEYGVFRLEDDERLASETEEDLFEALDLAYIPPEIREGSGEIEQAAEGNVPELIDASQVRGDVHMHTTETDGSAEIAEMAEAAKERGLDYIAITDHSEAVRVANGMTPDRLEAHIEAIRRADRELSDFTILAGIEVDILEEGELDMDHDLLAECDWVVGSIHSKFGLEEAAMTDRLLRAIDSGLVSALGHPTGRILGGRDGYSYDFERVVDAAADAGVALEINGSEGRIDLNADLARLARDRGARIVLGSDAHSTRGLDAIGYAVQQARRAGLGAEDVLNTQDAEAFVAGTLPG